MAGSRSCQRNSRAQVAEWERRAYWIREKHELHVRSLVNGSDNVVDALPDVTPQQMFWSVKGRGLVYPVNTRRSLPWNVRSGKMTTLTIPTKRP